MYSILIVQVSNKQWSFSITKENRTVYSSMTFWDTPEEVLESALEEYHEAERDRYQKN